MEALDIIQANIYARGLLRVKPQMTPNSKERQGTTERSECRRMEESSLNGGACAIVASAHAHSSYGKMQVRVERKYRMAPMGLGFRTLVALVAVVRVTSSPTQPLRFSSCK